MPEGPGEAGTPSTRGPGPATPTICKALIEVDVLHDTENGRMIRVPTTWGATYFSVSARNLRLVPQPEPSMPK